MLQSYLKVHQPHVRHQMQVLGSRQRCLSQKITKHRTAPISRGKRVVIKPLCLVRIPENLSGNGMVAWVSCICPCDHLEVGP